MEASGVFKKGKSALRESPGRIVVEGAQVDIIDYAQSNNTGGVGDNEILIFRCVEIESLNYRSSKQVSRVAEFRYASLS